MQKTYHTPPFLDETVALELVQDVLAFEFDGKSALLTCRMLRVEPKMYPSYGTEYENLYLPPEDAGVGVIQLDFCTAEIVRVRFATGEGVPNSTIPFLGEGDAPGNTPMVVGTFDDPVAVKVEEGEDLIILETESIHIRLEKKPWRMLVYAAGNVGEGKEIFSTRSSKMPTIQPERPPEINFDPTWNFYSRYAYPLGVARRDGNETQVFDSFDLAYDEHIYGFGERYLDLDKRGQKIHLWQEEVYSNTSRGAYKNIPFFVSSKGYGIFINTSYPITARVGELTGAACSLIVDRCTALDYYFIFGPEIRDILPRYTDITGKPALPPKWTFGGWMSRITYSSQEEVERVAEELRAHRIPTDVIHVDTGWFPKIGNCDLTFDPVRFPDPKAMTDRLRELGFRLSLWQTTNVGVGNVLYEDAKTVGGLVKRTDGNVYNQAGYDQDCGLLDYSNPDLLALMKKKFHALFDLGVAAIKVDFGEGSPVDGVFDSYPSYAMRNLYALLYNKALFEFTQEYYGEGNAAIWARSTWAGSQRYPIHWSGDGFARWEDMPCTLRSGLGFGLSGFVFWSHDIGGFIGNSTQELYARWVQLGAFSSHARAHGEPPREPWLYGETAENVYRQYMELRYRLLPYLYSQSAKCVQDSLPVLRAMVIDFQNDPTAAALDDQYMFGESFLVAPIMTPSNRRKVYLPQGDWVDYWTKQPVQGGGWLEVEAPLEQLPLWVRAGAIIPMGPVMQYVDEKALDPLTIELYAPQEAGNFTIYDQSKAAIDVSYWRENGKLFVQVDPTPGQIELVCYGAAIRSAIINGEKAAVLSGRALVDGKAGVTVALEIDRE